MAKKGKVIQFVVNLAELTRIPIEVQGKKALVITETKVVWPPSVTKQEIEALAAKAEIEDNPAFHNEKQFKLEIPGLEIEVTANTPDELPHRIAEALTEFGISVSDWEMFSLDDPEL